VFVYMQNFGLLVPTCNFRLLNEYLSESWPLCSLLWRVIKYTLSLTFVQLKYASITIGTAVRLN
jgi:hypothetical protein